MSSKSSKHIAVEPVSSVSLPSKPFKSCFLAFDGFWFVSALGCSIIESGLFFQHEASRVLPPLQAQMRRAADPLGLFPCTARNKLSRPKTQTRRCRTQRKSKRRKACVREFRPHNTFKPDVSGGTA